MSLVSALTHGLAFGVGCLFADTFLAWKRSR